MEQLGNRGSDVDIYVIGDRTPQSSAVFHKSGYDIAIHYFGSRRVDFEFWTHHRVRELAKKLRNLPVGVEFIADRLTIDEVVFIHRLSIALPLQRKKPFKILRAEFDFQKFQHYLIQEAIHRCDGAITDIVGMMDDGDYLSALFRCRELVNHTVDIYRFRQGKFNPVAKWRSRLLVALRTAPKGASIHDEYLNLSFPVGNELLRDIFRLQIYVDRCLKFSNEVITDVQSS